MAQSWKHAARINERLNGYTGMAYPELDKRMRLLQSEQDWLSLRKPGEANFWLTALKRMRAESFYFLSFVNPRPNLRAY